MKLLEKILVNVDLEKTSSEHVLVAEKLAEKFNSNIILLTVLPKEAQLDSLKNYVQSYANEHLDRIINGLSYSKEKVEKRIEYGNPFETILSISEIDNINLIINFNAGDLESGIHIDILSEKLVRKSDKPVMIFKSGSNVIPQNILCPIDFSQSSERALNNAIKIARVFKSKLFILNVYEPLRESFSKRLDIDFEEENKKLEAKNKQELTEFIDKFNQLSSNYNSIFFKKQIQAVRLVSHQHC